MQQKFGYLIRIQYLGFRYHGWAKQPGIKTVHHMVDRTLKFVFGERPFKTLGASRTDAMVSASEFAFELFTQEPLEQKGFLAEFNLNLPSDIRALSLQEVDSEFNIIQSPRVKEYLYLFAFGEKIHPFAAPLLAYFHGHLDIELMKEGARLFEGKHNFIHYCKKPSESTKTHRTIIKSRIEENTLYTANFFPEMTYAFHVHSTGFMRNQIRLMMGQLVKLGRGQIDLREIETSLKGNGIKSMIDVAPASGLILNKVRFGSIDNK